jgi:hypothetical protein
MVWFCAAFSGRGSQLERVMLCEHCVPVGSVEYEATGRVEKYPSVRGGALFCGCEEVLVVGAGVELDVDVVPAAVVEGADVVGADEVGADVVGADEVGLDVAGALVGRTWPPGP